VSVFLFSHQELKNFGSWLQGWRDTGQLFPSQEKQMMVFLLFHLQQSLNLSIGASKDSFSSDSKFLLPQVIESGENIQRWQRRHAASAHTEAVLT